MVAAKSARAHRKRVPLIDSTTAKKRFRLYCQIDVSKLLNFIIICFLFEIFLFAFYVAYAHLIPMTRRKIIYIVFN